MDAAMSKDVRSRVDEVEVGEMPVDSLCERSIERSALGGAEDRRRDRPKNMPRCENE